MYTYDQDPTNCVKTATIKLNEIKAEEKIMNLAFKEANEIYDWGMRTVLIYAILLWSFLIWAAW